MRLKKLFAAVLGTAILLSAASLTAAAEEEPSVLYYGDVNLDGEVDVTDIVALQKYILGLGHLKSESAAYCADLTGDGEVDVFDLGKLKAQIISTNQAREDGNFITAPLTNFYGTMPSQGNGRLAVFYVDFPDCKYDYEPSAEELNEICFGYNTNANDPNYPFDSLRSFYWRASKGVFDLTGRVFRYTAKNPVSYYGNDQDKTLLMTEIIQYFNRFVDFKEFDGNADGIIDGILVSVPKNAPEEDWWATSGQSYSNLEADGMQLGHVTFGARQVESAEDHRRFVSVYVHENGHNMGLPDYYLYYSQDMEGFHGESGCELMDSDSYSDLGCFSKLMLGWYRENQVQVYDAVKGGEQTFILKDAQTLAGNCLILPCGELDGNYNSEYMIFEYNTDTQNNSGINRDMTSIYGFTVASGIRGFHVQAAAEERNSYMWLTYQSEPNQENGTDDGIRLCRLINDKEGGNVFKTGDVIDGTISGFHWYAQDGSESVDTGYTVKIGEYVNGGYQITVCR